MKKVDLKNPKNGDLKVWWNPMNRINAFEYPVNSVQEGFILLDVLMKYDLFESDNLQPDYSIAGGLMVFDKKLFEFDCNGWCDWYSDLGGVIDNYIKEEDGLELLNKHLKLK